ncbi:MAG: 4-(cytidine 5'-diphospho)-2-C-methyl-D-erythritol kinase [Solirubrobacteraceae bacterium]
MRLRALAPGKLNPCLLLDGPRADGRHELVTLLESVSLADELELCTLTPGASVQGDEVECPGVPGPNLVARALAGLRARGWSAPAVRIEIRKDIPVAAGMGGGSADAGAALRLASEVASMTADELDQVAASLGADVPSQLAPGLALGTGAGEIVAPLAPLAAHAWLILPDPHPLSTADVYREADRLGLPRGARELSRRHQELVSALKAGRRERGVQLAPALLVNDLEPAARSLCPQIDAALAAVLGAGAERALVCGSGPTVAGLFWGEDGRERAAAGAAALAGQFPRARAAVPVGPAFGAPVRV